MSSQTFYAKLEDRWNDDKFVCIGLDIDVDKIPQSLNTEMDIVSRVTLFNQKIVEATHSYACAYKLNSAHYEKLGESGLRALKLSIKHIKDSYPGIPVILDAKRGDIGDTNKYYAEAAFDELEADAITVHPYIGRESLTPFLSRTDKGVIVMGANSADGAGEFQDLVVGEDDQPLYLYICRRVATEWNEHGNCAVTASANDLEKLGSIREAVGEMPLLLLGVGAQGGDVKECVQRGVAKQSFGLIINSSRAIIYASDGDDFAEAATRAASGLNTQIIEAYRLHATV